MAANPTPGISIGRVRAQPTESTTPSVLREAIDRFVQTNPTFNDEDVSTDRARGNGLLGNGLVLELDLVSSGRSVKSDGPGSLRWEAGQARIVGDFVSRCSGVFAERSSATLSGRLSAALGRNTERPTTSSLVIRASRVGDIAYLMCIADLDRRTSEANGEEMTAVDPEDTTVKPVKPWSPLAPTSFTAAGPLGSPLPYSLT